LVDGKEVRTCSEGYIVIQDEWSKGFTYVQAEVEGLTLTDEHWDVDRFLRDYYEKHRVQCEVGQMVKHFKDAWGKERGSSSCLHKIFPRGGSQIQGNRLAGLLQTKGEHREYLSVLLIAHVKVDPIYFVTVLSECL